MTEDPKAHVLVVDDNVEMARLLADQLRDEGYHVEVASGGAEALDKAGKSLPDVVVADLRMEEVDGLDVLDGMRELCDSVPVIIMTAFGAIDTAIEAMRRGAFHYLTKPFQLKEALLYVERALSDQKLRDENRALHKLCQERSSLHAMVGASSAMQTLFDLIERVAKSAVPVLVRGESGTGKELVSRALHFLGPRSERAFVAVNCTALPEALLESELFGHLKGAFTGAGTMRRGLFLEADGGTLLLDEIADMPHKLQAKLLRVLEDGQVRAVGADATRTVDVRVVAATHQPLEKLVEQGRFRSDLYYRLNVVPVHVPALRDRAEDTPLLIEHFLRRARDANPTAVVQAFSPDLTAALSRHPWPGNVRELANLVNRLVVVGAQPVADIQDLERHATTILDAVSPLDRAKTSLPTLRQLEADYIDWVLSRCEGNKTRAAQILGIDVSTLHRRGKTTGTR